MASTPIGIHAVPGLAPVAGRTAAAAPSSRRRALTTGALAALFVVCWSSGFIGAKLDADGAAGTTVLMWRFVAAAVLLLPFVLARGGRGTPRATRTDLRTQAAIGLLSQAGYLLTVYWAIALGVSTGTVALVDGLQPLVAAAAVGPILGVVVARRQWAGLVLGLTGVAVVCLSDAVAPGTTAPTWAYVLPLLGMASLVASTLLERRTGVRTPPMPALAIHCGASAVAFTALAVATGTASPPASGSFWLLVAGLVALPTLGGYGLYWLLVRRIGVTSVSSLLFLIAPVTSVWGAAAFGEPLTGATIAGLGLTLTAAAVVGRAPGDGDAMRRTGHPVGS